MKKQDAIQLLGGSVALAAEAIGIKSQAISQWPDPLTPKLADRVQAALWRMHVAKQKPHQLTTKRKELAHA